MVGDCSTGYIVVPHATSLEAEIVARCHVTGRVPSQWVRTVAL
jgi:predicted RNase H-like nuclease